MPNIVNRPMDNKQKEQDIERKLQLFGLYQGFKNGKLPSNKQCDIAMNSALSSKALTSPSKDLSEEGQALVKDLRNVIEQSKKLMLSKNDGQLLQEFIWGARHLSTGDAKKPNLPTDKESSKQDARSAGDDLKTLGTLLITNGEFRKLLNDVGVIARDMAGDASQEAANKVRPSEEQLAQVDQPAEENVWHEKPDKEQLKSRARSTMKKNKGATDETTSDVASTAKQESEGGKKAKKGTEAGAQKTKEKAEETESETKSRTSEMAGKAKGYLSEKIPQERRDQGIARIKKMIVEIQGHPDYERAIEALLSLTEKYAGMSKDVSGQNVGAAKAARDSDSVKSMEYNLRTLIERFANSTSLDDVFGALDNIYHDADEDPELKGWFSDMNTFIRRTLKEKGWATTDECSHDWNQLHDRGVFLLRHRYKNHTKRILDEIKFFGDQFNKDAQNKAFADSMQNLFNNLGRNGDGKVAFKKHLLKDLRDVIMPAFLRDVRYIPVPRLEVSDKMVDVVVENIVIESDNLMPNVIEFGSDNYFRWGRKKITNKRDNKIMIAASGIQADIRDISYYLKKKEGFPSISDKGIMDIFLGGEGFGFKIAASTAQKEDGQHFFKVDKVTVNIHDFDIKLKKSKHKVLFSVFKPMLFNVVRPALESVLTKQIKEAFVKGDEFAYEVHLEAKKAEEAAKNDPEKKRNAYARYMEAVRAKMNAKKEEDQKKPKRDTKVQTPATLHNSIFPDIVLPGAVSTKATGYEDLAKKGERWESPVFSIGKAAESSDIPKPAAITRKHHQTAESKRVEPDGKTKADGASKTGRTEEAYSSRGFADEVTSAIGDGDPKKVAGNGAEAKVKPNTAFNPQAA